MSRLSQRVFTYKSIPSADELPGVFVSEKLFKGGFGTIYKGIDPISQQEIAIKYSKFDLSNEYKIMKKLNHVQGIPKVYTCCEQNKSYHMTMEYLNQDLHTIQGKIKQLSLKTICFVAIKVIEILKEIHQLNIVHRDIKPSNLMVKSIEEQQIYLIDFGIAKEIDQLINTLEFEGTLLYDPIQSHKKLPYRFIDDIEMLSYTLLLLYKGHLPWQKVAQKVMAQNEVMQCKEQFLSSKFMSKLPFADLFGYIKWNQNNNRPDYDFLISLFRKILQDNKIPENYTYDWLEWVTPLQSAILKSKTTVSIFNEINQDIELNYTDLLDDETFPGISSLQQQEYKFFKN